MPRTPHISVAGDRLLLVGDVHGSTGPLPRIFAAGAAAGASDVVLLGDIELSIGGLLDTVTTNAISEALELHGLTGWIVAGNHDTASFIDSLPIDESGCPVVTRSLRFLPRTAILDVGDSIVAIAAGAASIDQPRHRETLTDDEYADLVEAAAGLAVDVLLGHDVPGAGVPGTKLYDALDEAEPWWPAESIAHARAENVRYTDMARRLRPRIAAGGHYHFRHGSLMDLGRSALSRVYVLGAVGIPLSGAPSAVLDLSRPSDPRLFWPED